MFVAYTAKIHGIIECVRIINGVISKILCDEWVNLRILSVQSLEAHQHSVEFPCALVSRPRSMYSFVEIAKLHA